MQGEGTGTILIFIAVLVVIMAAVIAWQLIKRKKSDYTYAYKTN